MAQPKEVYQQQQYGSGGRGNRNRGNRGSGGGGGGGGKWSRGEDGSGFPVCMELPCLSRGLPSGMTRVGRTRHGSWFQAVLLLGVEEPFHVCHLAWGPGTSIAHS